METDSPSLLNTDELQFLAAIRQATPEQCRNLLRRMKADSETSATPFHTKIRRELKRLSMTQIEVVTALGVDTGKVFKKVMREQQPAPFDLLVGLAGLGFDVSYLITGFYQSGGIGEAALHHVVLDAVDLLSLETKIDAKQLANAVGKLSVKHRRTGGVLPDPFLAGRLGRSPNPAVVTHSGLVNSDPVRHNIPRIASLKQLPWNLISPIDQSITHRPETARSLEKAREREYANPNQTESAQLHGRAALPARSRVETDRQRAKPVGL